jgi:hypothetical protein
MKQALIATLCLVAAVIATSVPAGAQNPIGLTYAVRDCTQPKVEPKSITLTCGDAGAVLKHLGWEAWNLPVVKGEGDLYLKDCDPSCVEGGVDRYRVKVKLLNVKTVQCAHMTLDMYQKAKLRYIGDAPPHANNLRSFGLDCVS